jgi:hypothetical protein
MGLLYEAMGQEEALVPLSDPDALKYLLIGSWHLAFEPRSPALVKKNPPSNIVPLPHGWLSKGDED